MSNLCMCCLYEYVLFTVFTVLYGACYVFLLLRENVYTAMYYLYVYCNLYVLCIVSVCFVSVFIVKTPKTELKKKNKNQ